MRYLYTLGLSLCSILAYGQFSPMAKKSMNQKSLLEINQFERHHFASPEDHNIFHIDLKDLFTDKKNNKIRTQLIDHKGSKHTYEIHEVQNMAPELSAKYPMIKSFRGVSVKNPKERISITINDEVIIARSHGHKENFYIQPIWRTSGLHSIASVSNAEKNFSAPVCGVSEIENDNHTKLNTAKKLIDDIPLRTYRVAIAANGEYSGLNGGTIGSVLTSIVGHLNLINEVFLREVGLTHILVAENDQLIFLDSATDPYDNDDNGAMMTQNTGIINGIIGQDAYDFGHIFGQGGGGVANLAVPCGGTKGRGHSGLGSNATFYKLVSHEIGHQFSAGHTWNFCTTDLNQGQRSSASASEPGSGSTIMSYAGLCPGQNVIGDDDPYYNAISVQQIKNFAFSGNGSSCATDQATTNDEPEVSTNYTDGFFIPISTPFVLRGDGTDVNGDNLTYNWDQFDFGPVVPLGTLSGNSPAFRSFPPDDDPKRYFPRLIDIINNTTNNRNEQLPDYSRDLTFRLMVRDNNSEVGATVWKDVSFKTTDSAGPFTVTDTEGNPDYLAGVSQPVKWDVANTDNIIVNCQKVNILLSKDGGMTFPDTLAKNTMNDGLEYVTFPSGTSVNGRLKVEAADNIFFDISNDNFAIVDPSTADYSLTIDQTSFSLCSADQANLNVGILPILGFSESVNLNVVAGLPNGATATFGSNPVAPNANTSVNISGFGAATPGTYPISIEATATGGSTQTFNISVKIVDANVPAPDLTGPLDGEIRVPLETITSWGSAIGAESYNYQLSTDAQFNNVIIDSSDILIPTLTLNTLDPNQLYFWRVRSTNQCANSDFSTPRTFYSKNQFCNRYSRQQTLEIKEASENQVVSTINVDSTFNIRNFSIPYIRGTHNFVGDLEFILQSPAGGNRTLINRVCDDSQNFDIGFDDEAVSSPSCPIDDSQVYLPQENLSSLNNSNGKGLYILFVKDLKEGDGGEFTEWAIEFCDDFNPGKPDLITNTQLVLAPMANKALSNNELKVTDVDTDDDNISFIVMSTPSMGDLIINGSTATLGDIFTQADITAGNVTYQNNSGANNSSDSFDFIVTDNAGGLIEQSTFDILLDANVSVIEILAGDNISLIPNPSNGDFLIRIEDETFNATQIKIFNLQGQEVYREFVNTAPLNRDISINANFLSNGLYQLSLFSENAVITRKFLVLK